MTALYNLAKQDVLLHTYQYLNTNNDKVAL